MLRYFSIASKQYEKKNQLDFLLPLTGINVVANVKLMDEQFTPDLLDTNSERYIELSAQVKDTVSRSRSINSVYSLQKNCIDFPKMRKKTPRNIGSFPKMKRKFSELRESGKSLKHELWSFFSAARVLLAQW